jgi:hypothetical protein
MQGDEKNITVPFYGYVSRSVTTMDALCHERSQSSEGMAEPEEETEDEAAVLEKHKGEELFLKIFLIIKKDKDLQKML